MHRLALRNPSVFAIQEHDRRPFLDGTNDDYDDDSTYNETDGEGNETDDSDDCPPPGHSDTPGDTGVTATNLRNLWQNTSVHDENTENNEEDRQSTGSEEEESITPSENENDPNDHKMTTKRNQAIG